MPSIGLGRGIGFASAARLYIMQDADAIAYVNAIGDIPANSEFRRAVDQLVMGHKSNSLWTKLHWAFLCPPSMKTTETLTNLKDATLDPQASLQGNGRFGGTYPCGYSLDPSGNNWFRTDAVIAGGDDSSAFVWAQMALKTAGTAYAMGADNGTATEFFQLNEYGSTSGLTGRVYTTATVVTAANSGPIGRYIANRNASNYLEVVKNGVVLGTSAVAHTGTTPNIHCPIGARNNNGTVNTFGDGVYSHFAHYDGLSTSERDIIDTLWSNFMTTSRRASPPTQLLFDGNSLTIDSGVNTVNSHRAMKRFLYNLSGINKVPVVINYGIGGQNTAAVLSDFPNQIVPKLNPAATKNIYMPWECTNTFVSTGNTTTTINAYWALCDAAKAAGFQVVAITMLARDFTGNAGGLTETQFNLGMDTINDAIRTQYTSHADYLVDINNANLWVNRSSYPSDAAYNTAIASIVGNLTYFRDGVHLTVAGYDIVGNKMYTDIGSVV